MGDEASLCSRCAQRGKTCCQICEIYVTPGDVQRIGTFVGHFDFFEFRKPVDPQYLDQDDDPEWARCVFRPDGSRRVLRRSTSGDCVFLGPVGCRLPWEVRPLVCRLYPVEYTAGGLKPDLADGCPVNLLPPGQDLLQALGMTWEKAEVWWRQLYAEIRLEPHLFDTGERDKIAPVEANIFPVRVDGPEADPPAPGGPGGSVLAQTPVGPAASQTGHKSNDLGKPSSYPPAVAKAP